MLLGASIKSRLLSTEHKNGAQQDLHHSDVSSLLLLLLLRWSCNHPENDGWLMHRVDQSTAKHSFFFKL